MRLPLVVLAPALAILGCGSDESSGTRTVVGVWQGSRRPFVATHWDFAEGGSYRVANKGSDGVITCAKASWSLHGEILKTKQLVSATELTTDHKLVFVDDNALTLDGDTYRRVSELPPDVVAVCAKL